jgi:DNA-binding FadR family transcriptional regulator
MIHRQVLALIRGPMEIAGSHPEVTARTIQEHEQIVHAIQRGALDELRTLLDGHLQRFLLDLELPKTSAE